MHGCLGRSGEGLAKLVACHEQPLVDGQAPGCVELDLLGIGLVVRQPVDRDPAILLGSDPLRKDRPLFA